MRECLKNFEIMEKDIIDLTDDPTMSETSKVFDAISKELREAKKLKPPEKYLIVFLFAGHGILRDGTQYLVYNEWNPRERFYHMFAAEGKLRQWAEIYPHAYIIGLFACCRQLYDQKKMTFLYSLAEAEKLGYTLKDSGKQPVHIPKYNIEVLKFQKATEEFKKATIEYEKSQQTFETVKKEEEDK